MDFNLINLICVLGCLRASIPINVNVKIFYLAERIYVEFCSHRYPMIDIKNEYNVEYLMNFDKISHISL